MNALSENQINAIKVASPEISMLLGKPVNNQAHIADLNREKAKLTNAGQEILNKSEGRDLTPTERDAFDGIMVMVDDVNKQIDLKRIAMEKGEATKPEAWRDQDGQAVRVYQPNEVMATDPGENYRGMNVGSMMRAMVTGSGDARVIQALSEGTNSAGGYTVPTALTRSLVDLMRSKNVAVQAGALTVDLNTEKTTMARVDSDPQPAWRLEEAAVNESEPTFGSIQFQARSLAVLVKVSRELLEDSINIEQALMNCLAQSMALEVDRVALMGSGTAPEPRGISNTAGVLEVDLGTDGAQISSYAPFLLAMRQMAEQNANAPTAAIMAPRTAFDVAGLVDTLGQPLQKPEMVKDLPFMQSTKIPVDETHGAATDASRIIAGDFTQMMIGIRSGLRIELLKERFAENMQYGFLAHIRADVAVAQPGAFCQIKGVLPAA